MERKHLNLLVLLSLLALLSLGASACLESDRNAPDGDLSPADTDSPPDGDADTPTPPDGDADAASEEPFSEVVDVNEPDSWISEENRTPRFLHLTYRQDPKNAVTVQWQTEFTDIDVYPARVWFVKESDLVEFEDVKHMPFATQFTRKGESFTYETQLKDPDSGDPYTARLAVHEVDVQGLEPGTTYHFRAGTWKSFDFETGRFDMPNLSATSSFHTAPEPSAAAKLSFVMAGDSRGGYEGIHANIERLKDLGADFWIFNGDMNDVGTQNEWFLWFEAMAPVLSATPLMPVQGNHEFFSEELYYYSFALPEEDGLPEGLEEHAWHFVYGNTLVIGLDSNPGTPVDQPTIDQLPWLRSVLERYKDDPEIVWRVAMTHHAPYSASKHGSTERLIEHFVPVFEEYGVDLAYAGHDHNYERSWPWKQGAKVEDGQGVVYIVAGGFYCTPYSAGTDEWTALSRDGDDSNYAVVRIDGRSLNVTAYNGVGEKFDETTLTKE